MKNFGRLWERRQIQIIALYCSSIAFTLCLHGYNVMNMIVQWHGRTIMYVVPFILFCAHASHFQSVQWSKLVTEQANDENCEELAAAVSECVCMCCVCARVCMCVCHRVRESERGVCVCACVYERGVCVLGVIIHLTCCDVHDHETRFSILSFS